MAFQDNSGGIIIDAVLTDTGRKYLSKGKFKITKFALGDDEIDYTFGAVSGSDFEISTAKLPPILEAFSNENANINYGLLSLPRQDILYLPMLKLNSKVDSSTSEHTNGIIHLSVNKETSRKLQTDLGASKFLEANEYSKNKIIIESGIEVPASIDAEDLQPTEDNKKSYILNMGLYDKYFLVYIDSKFTDELYISPKDSKFENDQEDVLTMNFEPLQRSVKTSLPTITDLYDVYRVEAVNNHVLYKSSTNTGNNHSVFGGPRASIFALNVKLKPELSSDSQGSRDQKYTKFGTTSNAILGSTNLYDFIDTTIYIQGLSSNSRLQIPVRIMRFVGTT